MLDTGPLTKALTQLQTALAYATGAEHGPEPELFEQFRNSVIQTFEYSYELCYKLVRRRLMEMAAVSDEIATLCFQDVIREAARAALIDDPEAWFDYRTVRNKTSHAYQEEFAQEAYQTAKLFLPEAQSIAARLRGR